MSLTGPCATGAAPAECTTRNWFPNDWQPPPHGVILLWTHAERPFGSALTTAPGKSTTIDHRPARVWSGPATSNCPSGTSSELDASVRAEPHSYPGESFNMTACFGSATTSQDREDVDHLLHSLQIRLPAPAVAPRLTRS
jgi:hypothetical protein